MLQWPLAGVVAKKLLLRVIVSYPRQASILFSCSLLGVRLSMHVCRFNSDICVSEIHPKDIITFPYLFILYFNIFIHYFDSSVTTHEHIPLPHHWTVPTYCFMVGII